MNTWTQIVSGTPVNPAVLLNALTSPGKAQPDITSAAKQEVDFLLRGLATVMNYSGGSPIFSAGGNANAVYRVVSGAVALWCSLPSGRRHIVDFRLRGDFFGVIHRPTETFNAEATSDCVVMAYRRGQVDEICDTVPSFRRSITILAGEPVLSRNEAAAAEARTAKERIAEFLLHASERAVQAGEITLPFSPSDIGERVDASRELVMSGLRDLEEVGAIVRTRDGGLMVINATLLQSQT